jgi:hypothetical protein
MLPRGLRIQAGDRVTGAVRAERPHSSPRDYQVVLSVAHNGVMVFPSLCFSLS